MPKESPAPKSSWLDRPLFSNIKFNWEIGLFILILILAFVTRFYHLGERVISHDETTHVYFSWQLFKGQGYSHHPLSHGPFLFHITALSYFLFGDGDFSARAMPALFGVASIVFIWWAFRRYLGRIGAMLASVFFLISPYMLYYSRYARNESWVAFFGLVMLWAILRYLDKGENKYLYIFTAAIALHFTAKETSFIYVAQALFFLGLLFLWRIGGRKWNNRNSRLSFFVVLVLSVSLFALAAGAQITSSQHAQATISATEVQQPVAPTDTEQAAPAPILAPVALVLGGVGVLALAVSLYLLISGYGWQRLKTERSFNLMLLCFALVLPHLSALPMHILRPDLTYASAMQILSNWSQGAANAADMATLYFMAFWILAFALPAIALGLLWSPPTFLINLGIFYAIFIPLYTTIFTNGPGFFSGLVGSLLYWLEQQGVQRGNQPSYYYWAVQIPIYEYLAAAGSILAVAIGLGIWRQDRKSKQPPDSEKRNLQPGESRRLALVLLAFWAVTSLAAFSVAGEKMPWLTVHIALPMLLLSGWALGWVIKRVDWQRLAQPRSLLMVFSAIIFIVALLNLLGSLLGTHTPFQGNLLNQQTYTFHFVFFLILIALSAYGFFALAASEKWEAPQLRHVFVVIIFTGLAFLTARTAFRAAYINYNEATEYLVYAHMAPGPKEVMDQVEEISMRLTDGLDLKVAYDNETSYPFWWYLRNYPNQHFYADQPGRDLRDYPVIIVGDANYGKIEPVVGQAYYMFQYNRIWWPNQDYFDFTKSSIGFGYTADTGQPASDMGNFEYLKRVGQKLWSYLGDAKMREDIFQIWLNRDFTHYLEDKGQDPSLAAWNPSRTMRLYIRKDVAAQIWDYGVQPAPEASVADPYEGKGIALAADLTFGETGTAPGQFNAPRGVAIAPDGSLFVADANNHRIQHLAADGTIINTWGTFADLNSGNAPGGTFNEPWGVAVSLDGQFVYVADTWNHRVQKFTAGGIFLKMWGTFGQDNDPMSLWGPRDLLVDNDGNLLVTDTGNKRIKVFDADGNFISQFGEFGLEDGQFNEPVGIALDRATNRLYVADTWNQRVQVFDYSNGNFTHVDSWDISGWYGQSLVNKPYIAVGANSQVYITDPEAGRVLVYNPDGTFAYFFGGFDQSAANIGVAQAVAADAAGGMWLTDSQNNKLLHFISQ
jgi:predicted membrane-bound mannosyltransferase/DNA-binding beta-propeller fold protein YncE